MITGAIYSDPTTNTAPATDATNMTNSDGPVTIVVTDINQSSTPQ